MSGFISSAYVIPPTPEIVGGEFLVTGDGEALGIDFAYHLDTSKQAFIVGGIFPPGLGYLGTAQGLLTYASPSVKWTLRANGFYAPTNGTTDLPFEWDIAGVSLGLRIEEARTNLVLRSQEFSNASWTKTRSSITADAAVAPDGTTTADKLIDTVDNNNHICFQAITTTSSATYTLSLFVKAAELIGILLEFDQADFGGGCFSSFNLSTGALGSSNFGTYGLGATLTSRSIIAVGNGWYRISITGIAGTDTATFFTIATCSIVDPEDTSYIGTGTDGVYIWGAQIELGSSASSPIPTTTVAVLRNADDITLATSLFPYSATSGTLYAKFRPPDVATSRLAVAMDDGTANEQIAIGLSPEANSTGRGMMSVIDGGVQQVGPLLTSTLVTSTADIKVAARWQVNDFAVAMNGGPIDPDIIGTLPTVTTLRFGTANGAVMLNGHLMQMAYIKRALTDSELVAKSTFALNTITQNIVTNWAAAADGVTDDGDNFLLWRTYARVRNTSNHVLTVPAGTYNLAASGALSFPANVRRLTIDGAGIGVTTISHIRLGGQDGGVEEGSGAIRAVGLAEANGYSARIATLGAGSTALLLVDSSYAARFIAGHHIMISAIDMQASGYPPNPAFFEYNRITRVDYVNGILYLETPLINGYRSTYPEFFAGDVNDVDQGGPATVYRLLDSYDTALVVNGCTLTQATQIHSSGRSITVNNCDVQSGNGVAPSSNGSFLYTGTVLGRQEFDKCIDTLTIIDSDSVAQTVFQSSSINNAVLQGVDLAFLQGTPRYTTIGSSGLRPSNIDFLTLGPFGFGVSETVVVADATVGGIGYHKRADQLSGFTISGNTLTRALAGGTVRWAIPGTHMFFANSGLTSVYAYAFQVTDYQQVSTDIVITTTRGSWPSSIGGDSNLYVMASPCPSITVTNSTGCGAIEELSLATPGNPYGCYINRTMTGNSDEMATSWPIWGTLVSYNVTVTQAYTGTLATLWVDTANASVITPADVLTNWSPGIDLRTLGSRTYTALVSATLLGADFHGGGAGPGTPAAHWFTRFITPTFKSNNTPGFPGIYLPADISAEAPALWPIFTITMVTDHGFSYSPYDTGETPYHG